MHPEERNLTRRASTESTALLSDESDFSQSQEAGVQADSVALPDEASVSDISSVSVPFYQHIKDARRAGILQKSAILSHQPRVEEEQ